MKKTVFIILGIVLPVVSGCTTIQRAKSRLLAEREAGGPHRGDVMPVKVVPAGIKVASNQAKPSDDTRNSDAQGASPVAAPAATPTPAATPKNLPDRPASDVVPAANSCVPLKFSSAALEKGEPVAITPPLSSAAGNYVITKIFRMCTTRDNTPGMELNSPWLAMGIPCSGGDGRVDWKGTNYLRPKLVQLIVANDCPMAPPDSQGLKELANKEFGIPMESLVGAYTPFIVQFWEIPSLGESDVGFSIDLRDSEARTTTWGKMVKGEPLRVVLIGRENAWTQTDQLYMVEADVVITTKNRFRLKPVSVKPMTQKDVEAARTRCEALRPARNCSSVF